MMDPPQQDFMDMGMSGDCCPPPINMVSGPACVLHTHKYIHSDLLTKIVP